MDFHLGPVFVMGPTLDAKVAAELSLRIPHLGLRVREQARRAMVFAERLQAAGAAVVYPGLPSHPQHELLRNSPTPATTAAAGSSLSTAGPCSRPLA